MSLIPVRDRLTRSRHVINNVRKKKEKKKENSGYEKGHRVGDTPVVDDETNLKQKVNEENTTTVTEGKWKSSQRHGGFGHFKVTTARTKWRKNRSGKDAGDEKARRERREG